MSKRNNSAFPSSFSPNDKDQGLTKKEYAMIQILSGLLSQSKLENIVGTLSVQDIIKTARQFTN